MCMLLEYAILHIYIADSIINTYVWYFIIYSDVSTTYGFIVDARVSTEVAILYSVLWLVKPILTSRQKFVATQKFTTRTSILRATYVSTFWGLSAAGDQILMFQLEVNDIFICCWSHMMSNNGVSYA